MDMKGVFMAVSKVTDVELMPRLAEAFRQYGYEGASLSLLSQKTGLQRASLYHRFPGGKEDMAEAVMRWVDDQFVSGVLAPLTSSKADLTGRIQETARRLKKFYLGGKAACALDALSRDDAPEAVRDHVNQSYRACMAALAGASRESGIKVGDARQRASDAMVQLHGGLVVARMSGETGPFLRAMKALPALLLDHE